MADNEKCIVLGNGPSLKPFDLKQFSGVCTIGMNAAYRYWDRIGWYPDIYCCLDDQLILSHADEILRLYEERRCKIFFLHHNILTIHPGLANRPGMFFIASFMGGAEKEEARARYGLPALSNNAFKSKAPGKVTTGSYAVRFAASLGYSDFLLLGIDCRYQEIIPEAVALEGIALQIASTPTENANYFFADYQQAGDRYNIPNPVVHNGNLHLQAFEPLVEDLAKYHAPARVRVGVTETELYTQKVFDYCAPAAFLPPRLSAIFMPIHTREAGRAARMIASWREFDRIPSFERDRRVDVCIASNQPLSAEERDLIVREFEATNKSVEAFKSLRFFSSNLEGDDDLYSKDRSKAGFEGFAAGPNNQHYDIILRFSRGYQSIFVMETDCVPIRPGWMDRLDALVTGSPDYWIMGTSYDGSANIKSFFHINGNALYNVGSESFIKFMTDEVLPHFYEMCVKGSYLSYDVLLQHMMSAVFAGKAEPAKTQSWHALIKRLKFSDFVANLSLAEDAKASTLPTNKLRHARPGAMLVHSPHITL